MLGARHFSLGTQERTSVAFDWSMVYLPFVFLTPVLSQFAQYLVPSGAVVALQPLSVVTQFVIVMVTCFAWIVYMTHERWSLAGLLFFSFLAASWLSFSLFGSIHGDSDVLSHVLLPVVVCLLALKRPSERAVRLSGVTFAWSLVFVSLWAQALDFLGVKALHYEGWNRLWIQVWDTFPILFYVVDYGLRWEGPFGNVNFAGPVGAFLALYGLVLRRRHGYILSFAGVVILFVSDSRSAWVAAGISVLVYLWALLRQRISLKPYSRILLLAALALTVVFFAALFTDESSTGRRSFWAAYISRWLVSPFIGVGDMGIASFIEGGALPIMATHGHNILVDPLLRYGLISVVCIGACLLTLVVVSFRAPRAVKPGVVGLTTLIIISGVAEDLIDWSTINLAMMPMLLAVLLADRGRAPLRKSSTV